MFSLRTRVHYLRASCEISSRLCRPTGAEPSSLSATLSEKSGGLSPLYNLHDARRKVKSKRHEPSSMRHGEKEKENQWQNDRDNSTSRFRPLLVYLHIEHQICSKACATG
jgi:hypothetical protein